MALKINPQYDDDVNKANDNVPVVPPAPQQPVGPPPLRGRPSVPRELMSARPAMTKIVPRSPDAVQAASQAAGKPAAAPLLTPEEEAERQKRLDYLRSIKKQDKRGPKGSKKWLVVVIIVLLIIAAGLAAAYWFINRDKPAPAATHTGTNSTQSTPKSAPAADANFKDYTSTNFSLSLKYPGDWTLNDAANGLTIISPTGQLPGSAGSQVSGAVVLAIRPQQTSLPEFKSGNAVAVLDSKNVNYSAPATGQRATTFLSYLQYNSTTIKGALDSIYVTGNAGYKKDQAIPMADVVKVNPLINVYFVQCATTCTPTSTTMNVNGESWASNPLNTTVETILKSLALN